MLTTFALMTVCIVLLRQPTGTSMRCISRINRTVTAHNKSFHSYSVNYVARHALYHLEIYVLDFGHKLQLEQSQTSCWSARATRHYARPPSHPQRSRGGLSETARPPRAAEQRKIRKSPKESILQLIDTGHRSSHLGMGLLY
ncbi:uncharacterized protein BKA55DRAFT_562448 [Fusarium redolens]|uniref:Secreted protein n=1 Tax=Fusarium redolens TaxID=48865 RepID=A0A9P9HL48_FUSRE|nr:uncharacterized protein BKA55DRAFT_562448 [Fusarium redolens]KAH7259366.1 hypothetical protein BKA55DRAFT_562448 [Fusarium redolens]